MPRGGARPGAGRKRSEKPATPVVDGAPSLNAAESKNAGNRGKGRKPGIPNKASQEAKELCSLILDDPRYFKNLQARALAGKLHPSVETMLWYYRSGKPRETHGFAGANGEPAALRRVIVEIADDGASA